MPGPLEEFMAALDAEEAICREKLEQDSAGFVIRAIINEFDFFSYNLDGQSHQNAEAIEDHYLLRLGTMRAVYLSFNAMPKYDFPVVTFARDKGLSEVALILMRALGLIEHGRRVAHSVKTGLCKVVKIDDGLFQFSLPKVLVDEGYHERRVLENFSAQNTGLFHAGLASLLEGGLEGEIQRLHQELVYVFRDKFIGYNTDPVLDEYYFGLAYHLVMNQDGFDTFHYSHLFGGIEYQKFVLATVFFISLSLKHQKFCKALLLKDDGVRLENILTVSADWSGFVEDLAGALNHFGRKFEGYTEISAEEAEHIANVLSISRSNVEMISRPAAPLPYLIRVSNEGVVKLIVGAAAEPIHFLLHSLRHHFSKDYDKNQQEREGVLQRAIQKELLKIFPNLTFRHNLRLRRNRKVLTDIDLSIFDQNTGTVLLCQIKYQDLYGADLLTQYGRHSRLIRETENWLKAVELWWQETDIKQIRSTFHLSKKFELKSVYKFILSKHFAYPLKDTASGQDCAYANWPQLLNALMLMKKTQGTFITLGGLIRLLRKQNMESKTVEYLREPDSTYTVGRLSYIVRQGDVGI